MYKIPKQTVSMSVLDLVQASDSMVCKEYERVEDIDSRYWIYLLINWHILTRNKEWNDDGCQGSDSKFDPKYVTFSDILRLVRDCSKGPDIPVEVNGKNSEQD